LVGGSQSLTCLVLKSQSQLLRMRAQESDANSGRGTGGGTQCCRVPEVRLESARVGYRVSKITPKSPGMTGSAPHAPSSICAAPVSPAAVRWRSRGSVRGTEGAGRCCRGTEGGTHCCRVPKVRPNWSALMLPGTGGGSRFVYVGSWPGYRRPRLLLLRLHPSHGCLGTRGGCLHVGVGVPMVSTIAGPVIPAAVYRAPVRLPGSPQMVTGPPRRPPGLL
jgi:hypothetical protein